jgi:soluble lytic murein transglycosylase-like protein
MNDRHLYIALIKQECSKRNLDAQLICAIVETESAFNTWAIRFEPGVMRPVSASVCARLNRTTEETETTGQRISWGLGQVLGSTARWIGFRDALPSLCDPKQGIFWACEAFDKLGGHHKLIEEQIASYNAGSVKKQPDGTFVNQKYVDRVLQYYRGSKYE